MMKFGGGGGFSAPSSMLLFLFLFFFMAAHISDAVQCPHGGKFGNGYYLPSERKSCEACVKYLCQKSGQSDRYGCPEDFFRDCAGHSKAVDYVKYYNPLKACFTDGTTHYVSGCENEADGGACMEINILECNNMKQEGERDGYGNPTYPFYNGSNGIGEGIWKLTGMILLGWILARFY